MEVKLLEVRDRATFLPVFAMAATPSNEGQRYLLSRAGYGNEPVCIIVGRLRGGTVSYDLYSWGDRTMATAHDYINKHFNELKDGDVIDVEFILGETTTKKTSERLEIYEQR